MIEFTIRQLEIFVTVVEKNSFSRAAEALALAQSTVSGHIRGLEEALSLVLFVRDAKKQIRLTERGREVYALAKPIVDQCRVMSEELLVQPDARELSIAASTDAFEYLLPDLMTAYQRTHAGCRFLLVNGDSAFVHEQLRARHARIGFVGTALRGAGAMSVILSAALTTGAGSATGSGTDFASETGSEAVSTGVSSRAC